MTTSALSTRAHGPSSSPSPISWPPSQYWDGDDGNWSSFALRVGNPEQLVRVLLSTASESTWVVPPSGCPPDTPGINPSLTCSRSRGGLFDFTLSKSWFDFGDYSLDADTNLGYDASATYGLDTVALGLSNTIGGPTLQSQVVAGLDNHLFYTGFFGLSNQPSNFTASSDSSNLTDTIPYTSFLATMKSQNLIPSLSWAYTAGARYELKGVYGSLTFGGYDLSRLVPNNVSFDLAPDISRDLIVDLLSITSTAANGSAISLLPNSVLTFFDSTIPFIYLSYKACQAFETAFGLTYDRITRLYAVNDTLHQSLSARNPTFTFQIANSQTGGPTVDIVLPYASFDLLASYPGFNATRYFPLKRAENESQYTLGRTFLQEAYLITNYEYNNFSVSQARFDDGLPKNIIALPSAGPPTTLKPHRRISRNSVIGLAIGAFLVVSAFLFYFMRKRLRKHPQKKHMKENTGSSRLSQRFKLAHTSASYETADNSSYFRRKLPDSGKVKLLDENSPSGCDNKISELSQSPSPTPLCELETRHTSLTFSSLPRQSDRNRNAIFVSYDIWRQESRDSSEALSPCVETKISSSSKHKSQKLCRSLPTPPQLTAEYLNRDLPSTPNADSTLVLTDIEIVVPPGTPKSQMPSRARNREDQQRTYASFF